ncbi:MAG: bifunctional enoyl-CoA hydratase/phosphate acetyltransferase [Eubacterium sp.]|nr:bifunctional enoyl-CoA hydratase/phosphate acetyltransferase [Eubacterium sp.]
MMIKSFKELAERAQALPEKTTIALVCAHDEHSLEGISNARKDGIANAVLIGNVEKITEILTGLGDDPANYELIECEDKVEGCAIAARLVNEGKAGVIMKGKMETSDIMRGLLKSENNLRTGKAMSVCGIYECPGYHKIFAVSDQGLNVYPDLEGKKSIIQNAVELLHALGHECPKVGVLCAVEKVNPKMKETVEADELKQMNVRGEIEGCIVEGPISFDLATEPESAKIKGYESPVAGDADILVAPDLIAGNVLVKCLTGMAGATTAGLVLGAKVPAVTISRSATASDKYYSIAMACAIAPYFREKYAD